jgi:small ligand-binding sensory domain FIST
MSEEMLFFSASSTQGDPAAAAAELEMQMRAHFLDCFEESSARLDLMIVFLSSHFVPQARQVMDDLRNELSPRLLIGCSAEGVIGREQEIEEQPAITLVAGQLPGIVMTPFLLHAPDKDWHKLLLDQEEFQERVGAGLQVRLFILFGDPFSTPMDDILQAFNTHYPGIPVVGGMASAALRPQGNALILNDQVVREGVVGVCLSGALDVDVIVSQGCRPIWRPFRVSTAHRNVIFNLEGRPPLTWIQELIPGLPEADRALLQNGLFVGRAFKSGQEMLGRGDFLIRGVIGMDQQSGAIAIGESIMEGEMIQFHLRDAVTAQEDLEMMLIPQLFRQPPRGALLFSCNGRGTRLYDHPDGDISIINKSIDGGTELAGCFCAGEIGPIGGLNFLHGHTASLVLFRPGD